MSYRYEINDYVRFYTTIRSEWTNTCKSSEGYIQDRETDGNSYRYLICDDWVSEFEIIAKTQKEPRRSLT